MDAMSRIAEILEEAHQDFAVQEQAANLMAASRRRYAEAEEIEQLLQHSGRRYTILDNGQCQRDIAALKAEGLRLAEHSRDVFQSRFQPRRPAFDECAAIAADHERWAACGAPIFWGS